MTRLLLVLGASALVSTLASLSSADEPGIVVERIRAPIAPELPIGDRVITLVRVDLSK